MAVCFSIVDLERIVSYCYRPHYGLFVSTGQRDGRLTTKSTRASGEGINFSMTRAANSSMTSVYRPVINSLGSVTINRHLLNQFFDPSKDPYIIQS
jgi:hypothetical protein